MASLYSFVCLLLPIIVLSGNRFAKCAFNVLYKNSFQEDQECRTFLGTAIGNVQQRKKTIQFPFAYYKRMIYCQQYFVALVEITSFYISNYMGDASILFSHLIIKKNHDWKRTLARRASFIPQIFTYYYVLGNMQGTRKIFSNILN